MKIGIISDRLNRPLTGIGNYVYNLINELSKIDKGRIYLINYKENNLFPELNKIIIKNPFEKFPKKPFYFWHLYLNYYLNRKKLDLDIIHSPENIPIFVKLKYQKKIITVHDIIPYIFPKTSIKLNYYRYKYIFPLILKTTDKIITDSYHTKKDLIKHFKIPEDKIKVIHLAANENYKPLKEEEINKIKRKYNLNYPVILYVGALSANKNIPTLLKAFYKLKKQGIKHKLVITGEKRWKYKSIFETIEKLNLQKDVIFTGYVPDEDLPALYNAADLFVYPSLYEGFGLPPLEAMACGTPVITSNTSSLPEVVGDAGIMVNPYDVDELANKMYNVLTNDGLREELSKKGLERAKLFSWKKCAEEHLKVYEEVYNMK
ncbi:glycosyltransferase family 4 protein [Methanotorris igneus]|uniref:Glycosyl transferase group 1 n=1 Tax=Methanotorris igneus (strain DSM 5666 / JCM 11834 / Kol 5) TaxID=880724 RepID=F6BAX0_METIK|nr:glycosyltransferase family 1 protein [Methanotorris igneus]AEF97057.1 glycosyl transferase group 1 [Methanotorris igneus Kol 5]